MQSAERAKLSCLLHQGPVPLSDKQTAEPRGAREAVCRRRLPRNPAGASRLCLLRIQGGRGQITGFDLHACAGSEVACWGVATAGQSSFSQLKLSEYRRKQLSSATTRHMACNAAVNAFQQYEPPTSLATANLRRTRTLFALAHPPILATPRIHWRFTQHAC